VDSGSQVLIALARRFAFRDLAELVPADAHHLRQLCEFGRQLIDLDAEDFGEAGELIPPEFVGRALASRMPQRPDESSRGALGSLVPAYRLFLAVMDVRWQRRDMAALLATAHIAAEYAPLLAWEPVLGHAGDPQRIAEAVVGADSLWGKDDAACPHTRPEQSAAARVLRVANEPPSGWTAYLDRQHTNTSRALATCAIGCRHPCSVLTRVPPASRAALTDRVKTAVEYGDSAFVRLRHAAPVGHGFGVPTRSEVVDAWTTTRSRLSRYAPAASDPNDFVLPGLPAVFSAIAGTDVQPSSLVSDVATEVIEALRTLDTQ